MVCINWDKESRDCTNEYSLKSDRVLPQGLCSLQSQGFVAFYDLARAANWQVGFIGHFELASLLVVTQTAEFLSGRGSLRRRPLLRPMRPNEDDWRMINANGLNC